MKTQQKELLNELSKITVSNIQDVERLNALDIELLNKKSATGGWSILECLEHLNRYDSFYLPAIANHLANDNTVAVEDFKSGFAGNYLVNAVIPKDKGKKMKTFAEMDPSGKLLNKEVIATFLAGQHTLLKQLEAAEGHNLNRTGIPVTFTKLVKLKLGDAFRFMTYHNLRHVQQAVRNLD